MIPRRVLTGSVSKGGAVRQAHTADTHEAPQTAEQEKLGGGGLNYSSSSGSNSSGRHRYF